MRKHYLDNIRWITVVIVVIYHVLYMYNAEGVLGGLGRITDLEVQYYDLFQYFVYPWIMPVLFVVSGISSRLYLDRHTDREFIKARTAKVLVPSTIGVLVFHFIQGYVSMSLGGGFTDLASAGVPGPVIYLIIYLASGLVGNIATLFYFQKTGRNNMSAGASGCIFGLLGSCLVLAVAGYGFSLRSIITTLVINLIYGLSSKNINMVSHAGGVVGGAAIMAAVLAVI